MLPLTISYARELLAQEPELEANLRDRWAEYYVQLLHQFEVGYEGAIDKTIDDYRLIVMELDNIFAVLEWCYSLQRWSQVSTSVHLLSNLLYIRGLWAEREHWIELGREAALSSGDPLAEGMLLCDKAWVLSRQGKHTETQEVLEEARAIAESIASDLLLRYALLVEGDSARRQGFFAKALKRFNSARQGCGEKLDRHLARLDYYTGQVYCDCEQLAEAKDKLEAVMDRAQHLRWHRAIAHVYLELGNVALKDDDYQTAWVMLYEKSLPMLEEWEDAYELATCALLIGEIAEKKGEMSEAVLWTRKAKRVFEHQERKDKVKQAKEQLRRLGVSSKEIRDPEMSVSSSGIEKPSCPT
jgi:LuxR family glucitol operon transcriptional activator